MERWVLVVDDNPILSQTHKAWAEQGYIQRCVRFAATGIASTRRMTRRAPRWRRCSETLCGWWQGSSKEHIAYETRGE